MIVVVHQENVAVRIPVVCRVVQVLIHDLLIYHQPEHFLLRAGRQTEAGPGPGLPGGEIFLAASIKHSAKCPALLPPGAKPLLVAVSAAHVEMVARQGGDAVQPGELTVTQQVLVGGVEHVELVGHQSSTHRKVR